MRKIFIFLFFFASCIGELRACDICGCGGGDFYMGLLPSFKNKFIGIRYHYSQFHTQLAGDASQFSYNYYNSVELWGGWNIGRKWQLLAFVPYYFNKQADDDGTTYKNGFGDISFLANYQLLHSRRINKENKIVEQELWFGAGLKLPTGSFKVDVNDPNTSIADINAQIGTGSVDVLLNLSHHIRINSFGINTIANYKINTTNSSNYKYGNKLTVSSIGYYRIKVGNSSMAPNAGMVFENTETNLLKKEKVDLTGGYALSGLAGVEFTFNKIAVGLNVQAPLTQYYAAGQTRMQIRGMAHVTFVL
jgi:hypothetical protein